SVSGQCFHGADFTRTGLRLLARIDGGRHGFQILYRRPEAVTSMRGLALPQDRWKRVSILMGTGALRGL
ncbi:MAG: hypothetical protein V7741_17180, partial [Hyphomonas sp.]